MSPEGQAEHDRSTAELQELTLLVARAQEEMIRGEQELQEWLADHREEGLIQQAAKEREQAEEAATIAAIVQTAQAAGHPDAPEVSFLCGHCGPRHLKLLEGFIERRTPLEEVRTEVLNLLAAESEKIQILSKPPKWEFTSSGTPDGTQPVIEAIERALRERIKQHTPTSRDSTPAALMELQPCLEESELTAMGIAARLHPALSRIPTMLLRELARDPKRYGEPDDWDQLVRVAADYSQIVLAAADQFRIGENAFDLAADLLWSIFRIVRIASPVTDALKVLRDPAQGQRWVVEGVFDRSTRGHLQVSFEEIPYTLEPWDVELVFRALTGEQRHRLMNDYLATNADDLGPAIRAAFQHGVLDAETGEPYFKSLDPSDLYGLPIAEVMEIAGAVLWLSGLIPKPRFWPSHRPALGSPDRGPADNAEIPYLHRAVHVDEGHPNERDELNQLTAIWLERHQPEWRSVSRSVFGLVGRSILNERADYWNQKTHDGRLIYWDDRSIEKGDSGLDTAYREYGQPRHTPKSKGVDAKDSGKSIRLERKAFFTPLERLQDTGVCFSDEDAKIDVPRKLEDIQADLRCVEKEIDSISLAQAQRSPEWGEQLFAKKEELTKELAEKLEHHNPGQDTWPQDRYPVTRPESLTPEHFDEAVIASLDIDRAFHDVYLGQTRRGFDYAAVFETAVELLPCSIRASQEQLAQRVSTAPKSPFPFAVGTRVEHEGYGIGTVDGVYNTDGWNYDPTVVSVFDLTGRGQFKMSEVLTKLKRAAGGSAPSPVPLPITHVCTSICAEWSGDQNAPLNCYRCRAVAYSSKNGPILRKARRDVIEYNFADGTLDYAPDSRDRHKPNSKHQRFLLELLRKRKRISYARFLQWLSENCERQIIDLSMLTSGETEPLVRSLRTKESGSPREKKDRTKKHVEEVRAVVMVPAGEFLNKTKGGDWPRSTMGYPRGRIGDPKHQGEGCPSSWAGMARTSPMRFSGTFCIRECQKCGGRGLIHTNGTFANFDLIGEYVRTGRSMACECSEGDWWRSNPEPKFSLTSLKADYRYDSPGYGFAFIKFPEGDVGLHGRRTDEDEQFYAGLKKLTETADEDGRPLLDRKAFEKMAPHRAKDGYYGSRSYHRGRG